MKPGLPAAVLLSAISLSVAALGAVTLIAIVNPESGFAAAAASWLPLPGVWGARADAAIRRPQADFATARQDTLRELRGAPASVSAWLRRAYIDTRRQSTNRLTGDAKIALARSYALAPYDLDNGIWRLSFVFGHWTDAGSSIRAAAIQELAGLWQVGGLRSDLSNLPVSIADPAGRLAASLEMKRLESSQIHE